MAPTIVVVGATRILRPAATELARAGHTVIAVARGADDLAALAAEEPGIVAAPADWSDGPAFAAAVTGLRADHAIAYWPGAAAAATAALRAAVTGDAVAVVTSAAARPAVSDDEPFDLSRLAPAPPSWHRLLLGWTAERPARWHTPSDISAAALETLRSKQDRLLGVVRPWRDRPA